MFYKKKYLKYKLKYLKLKGGSLEDDRSKEYMPETLADLLGHVKRSHNLHNELNTLEKDYRNIKKTINTLEKENKNIKKTINSIEEEYNNIVEEYESHREIYNEEINKLKKMMKEYFENEYLENNNLNIKEIDESIKKKIEIEEEMEKLKIKESEILKKLKEKKKILKTLKESVSKKRKISETQQYINNELDNSIYQAFKLSEQFEKRGYNDSGRSHNLLEDYS